VTRTRIEAKHYEEIPQEDEKVSQMW
jgi:hypothetical protein